MVTASIFQDFGSNLPTTVTPSDAERSDIEDQKLEAFENGYQAGWEDAAKAQFATNATVSSTLATSLQSASLDYNDMKTSMQNSVNDVMQMVIKTILPRIAKDSLGVYICDEIKKLAEKKLEGQINLFVNEANLRQIEISCADVIPESHKIIIDKSISEDRVAIRFGENESVVDTRLVVSNISEAISEYFNSIESETQND